MESTDVTVEPLLAVRDRLDAAIQGYLDKVAALRKRRESVQAAIDIVRAGDDEIMKLASFSPSPAIKKSSARVVKFDEMAVEQRVLTMLETGPMGAADIHHVLLNELVPHSISGLKAILNSCPKIKREGERNTTVYRRVVI